MITNISHLPATTLTPAKAPPALLGGDQKGDDPVADARDLKQTFAQFVGETFFGQMLKSMRSTVGEPAFVHGGMAERQFQAQLDQHLSRDMAASGANPFTEGLFRQQFPTEAALLDQQPAPTEGLSQLDALRRR